MTRKKINISLVFAISISSIVPLVNAMPPINAGIGNHPNNKQGDSLPHPLGNKQQAML